MSSPANLSQNFDRPQISQVVKFCTLLIGLPTVLYLLLALTQAKFGGWPAAVITVVIGIGLSVVYTRAPSAKQNEAANDSVLKV